MIIDQLFDHNKKNLNEADPRNFDSDEDYYAAKNAPAKRRSAPSDYPYSKEQDDDYFREIFRKKREAAKKAAQDKESGVAEQQVYESFYKVGRMLVERKMSEKEILDVFAQAEAGITNTGANRTMLGRGKDATSQAYTNVKDSINKVLDSIQNSAPVAGVDVAYDQATDALANAVGPDSKVMDSIKKYRLLAKEYPKTQLFVKTALIALAGLATGGAALPVIAGLTAAVDSAIKGEKLSSLIGKGAGAGLMGLGAQEVSSMLSGADSAATPDAGQSQQFQLPNADAAMNSQVDINAAQEWLNADPATRAEIERVTGMSPEQLQSLAPSRFDSIASNAVDYQVKSGDTLSDILANRKINPEAFKRLPGNEVLFSPDGNPNIIKAGQTIKLPDPADVADLNKMSFTTPSDPNLAKDFDNPDFYTGQYNQNSTSGLDAANNLQRQELGRLGNDNGMSAARVARDAVRESIRFKTLPAEQLIDQKLTVLTWALNESVNRKSNNIHLTTRGVYTVFENVDRYRQAIVEYTQPGREQIPNLLRPDMPNAPLAAPDAQAAQPGMIGKGLNWLNKKAGDIGRQFTTGVTKEKLKMNWHQAGKPTDSDQLAAWLVTQKVPQQVVSDVFSKMSIPYTAPAVTEPTAIAATTEPTEPTATGAQATTSRKKPGSINLATGKPYTAAELAAYNTPATTTTTATATATPADNTADTTTTATATAAGKFPGEDPTGPNYVGRREVARRQAARDTEAAKKPATPNFAQQGGGYKSVNYAPNIKTGVSLPKPAAAPATASTTAKLPAGGGAGVKAAAAQTPQLSADEYIKRIGSDAQPVAETVKQVKRMMETVTTKADVQRIKDYIDYHMGTNLTEGSKLKRNRLLSEVTQLAAVRRREIARGLT